MDMLGKPNVERAARGAAEREGGVSMSYGDRKKEKLTNSKASSQHVDQLRSGLAYQDEQSNARGHHESTTEHNTIGQVPDARSGLYPHSRAKLQGRTVLPDSLTTGTALPDGDYNKGHASGLPFQTPLTGYQPYGLTESVSDHCVKDWYRNPESTKFNPYIVVANEGLISGMP